MKTIYIVINKNADTMMIAFTKEEDALAYASAYNRLPSSSFDHYIVEELPLIDELIPITLGEGD